MTVSTLASIVPGQSPRVLVRAPLFYGECRPAVMAAGNDLDPMTVRPGDLIGRLKVLAVNAREIRQHASPCHCTWGIVPEPNSPQHDNKCCCTLPLAEVISWTVECRCGWQGEKSPTFNALTCGRMNPSGACLVSRRDVEVAA